MYAQPRDKAAVYRGFLAAIHVIFQVTLLPFTLSLAHALQLATRFASGLVFTVIITAL